jgi:Domain of unknown function (DUF397)
MVVPEHYGFRRSTRCDEAGCVEVARAVDGSILVRDSKIDESPVLGFGHGQWADFVASVRDGQFG